MQSYDHQAREPRHSVGEGEEDAFLDRMSGLLDAIVRECASIGRTDDASAVLAKATSAFEGVQRMCRDAGIVHADAADERVPMSKNQATRVMPVRSRDLQNHTMSPSPRNLFNRQNLDLKLDDRQSEDGSLPPPTPLRCRLPLSTGDDIIEVEITDILTSTQEEIQRWKHEFRLQMMEQEAAHHDQHRAHMEQIQTLNNALAESQRHISKLARTIQDTNEKLESMQALTTKSQKAMELTLKEHTQYWKAICHDLVVEKRTLATKLSEERGKCHALREHLGMHDSGDKTDCEARPASSATAKRSSVSDSYATKTTASKACGKAPLIDGRYDAPDDPSPPRASFRRYYLKS